MHRQLGAPARDTSSLIRRISVAPLRAPPPERGRVPKLGPRIGRGAFWHFADRSISRQQNRPLAPVRLAGESKAREARGSRARARKAGAHENRRSKRLVTTSRVTFLVKDAGENQVEGSGVSLMLLAREKKSRNSAILPIVSRLLRGMLKGAVGPSHFLTRLRRSFLKLVREGRGGRSTGKPCLSSPRPQ